MVLSLTNISSFVSLSAAKIDIKIMATDIILTVELHRKLKADGFNYILIKDVVLDKTSGRLLSVLITVHKSMPALFKESCTAIDDAMIVNLLEQPEHNTVVYLVKSTASDHL